MRQVKVKTVRSIERVFEVLNCFSLENRELSLNQFAEKTGLNRVTLYRILHTAEKMGYISYSSENDRYRLTMKLFELGAVAVSSIHFRREVSRFLDDLALKTPHTILVAAIYDEQLVYLDKRESSSELKVGSEVGQIRPPDYGILGKTMLAYLPENERQHILLRLEQSRTEEQMNSLRRFFEQTRMRGYAYARDETIVGVSGVAAPIFDHTQKIVAALGILAPTAVLREDEIENMIRLVRETSEKISVFLGYKKGVAG